MVGVYNGDPAPPCASDDPQRCNDHGLDFELDDDPLLMVEGVYRYNQEGRLPGAVKVGGWNHFGTFEDQRFDSGGALIAVTGNAGKPLDHDWGLYGIIDQLIWRVPGSEDPQGVGVFARFIGAPEDRNLIDFYFDGGFTFTGMIKSRPNDAFAIGFAYTNISDQVSAFDVDFGEPVARNYEALIEICYTYQINPGWSIQPDFQYIFQPGGNVAGIRTQRLWGHAPASASDEGRVHSPHSKSRDRVIESSLRAPSRKARRAWLGGAIAFGAALPLLAGALQTYGEGADAAIESLLAPTTDFTKLEAGRGQARRRRHLARLDQHRQRLLALLRQHGFQARARLQDRQCASSARTGCRRRPRPTLPTGSGLCSIRAAARTAT